MSFIVNQLNTLTGQRGAFLQPGKWGRSESGNYDTFTYEGSKREVANLAAGFAQTLGLSYDVDESYGKSKLTVYFPWNMHGINPATDFVIKWEFYSNRIEKDLLSARVENPTSIALLSPAQIMQIRQFMLNPPDGTIIPFPTASDFQKNGETNGDIALSVFQLMMQGVVSFPVEAPSLRRTIITSSQYAVAASLQNVRKVLSTATLISGENVPNFVGFGIDQINDSWVDPNPNAPSLAYGWYKHFPTIQQVALLKWQIVQEWDYGLWSTLLWGIPL